TTGADGKATAEVTSTTAGTYLVTATVNGKATQKNTTFVADGATAEITDANLVIDPDGAAANGVAKNGVTATVTDAQGNLVPGAAVSFTVADGASITTVTGTTGADGKATAEVTSTTAGTYLVTATVNGKATSKNTTFVADGTTAEITDANLTIEPDNSPANGVAKNGVTATVTDATGNVVPGAAVSFTVADGATITTVTGTTGADGNATAEVSSTTAGTYLVTATVNGKATSKNTTFVADGATAEITDANLTIDPDNSPANGMDKNGVTAVVTDATGNVVPGAAVSFTVESGATLTTVTGTTGADGKATAEVTSTMAGTYRVTATVNGKATHKETTFVADGSTAEITDANLTIEPDNSPANGTAKNGVTAVVTDAQGNVVPDAVVTFSVADGATITTVTGTTGADGKATAEVTSTTAGTYLVTATVNGKATSKNTTFVADGSTAEITDANLTIDPDNSPANGTDKNGVTAVVTDATGNVVPDAVVTFSVADGATITTVTGTTGADGKATAEVTSTTAGTYLVTATVNGKATSKNTTFVADGSTAEITDANLTIEPDNSPANGTAKNGVTAVVTDATGNVVPDAVVTFSVADGATITTVTGTTGADGKATAEVSSTTAGTYLVTATVNGKATSKNTTFVADGSTAEITDANLVIDPDGSAANGAAKNGVTATVTDATGNVVPDAVVTFSVADGATLTTVTGTTGADGKATAEVTSTTAGTYLVTATVNGKATQKETTFVADGATAEITDANLTIDPDNSPANGTAKNGVTAIVTDAQGNLVPGAAVSFTVESGATITTVTGTTGADGKATAEVTSTTAGTYLVTATVNGKATQKETTFVADGATAEITDANLTIEPDNSPANGTAKNGVTAIVTDAQGNLVPGAAVSFTVESGATITTVTGTTGADGKATAEVTSTTAGTYLVTATVNGNATSRNTTFIADATTAEITDANLTIDPDNSPANGMDKNGVTAIVTDAQGNLVPDAAVSFTVESGATITTVTGTTGADGKATAEVTSTTAGTYTVMATVNGNATSKETTFIADATTAEITDANLVIDPDGAVANGVAKNGAEATVTDANGNLVPGVKVDFSISEGADIHVVRAITDENGKAYAEITSLKAGTFLVSAHVNGKAQFSRKNTRFVADMSTAKIELVRLGDKEQFVVGSSANYTATAMDANGNLITDAEFELDVKGSENASGAILVVNDGVAALFVTDTKVGDVELNVVLQQNNDVRASGSVAFIADKGTATIAENDLTILKTGAVASGTDENSVQARVTDAYGNILTDMDVTFGVNKTATLAQNVIKTDSEGLAVAHLTDTAVETVTVTATINGNSQAVEVEFVVGQVNPSESTATLEPVRILANGTEQATITVKLEDFFGHPVPGKNVTVEIIESQPITISANVQVSETVDHADGSYSLAVSGTKAGTVQFNILVDGNSIDLVTDRLTLVSTGEIAENDMVIDPDNAVADGVAKNVVTAVVKDFSGTPVAGDVVTFNVEGGAVLTPVTTTTGDDGKAVAEITSTKAGSFKVTATVNGKSTSKDTTFVADATTANLVLAPVNNEAEYYYAGYKAMFTATVVDGNDNLITDADFEVYASGTETVVATLESVSAGKGTISISDTAVGDVNLVVKLKGNEQVSDSTQVKFVADVTSAQILDADVYVENDGALAASYGSIVLTFTVKDRFGNPVPRALGWRHEVEFTPEGHSGNVSSSAASVDDGTGATIAITAKSGMAGQYRVALTIDKTNYIYRNIYYVGVMAPFEVFTDNALANGVDENRVGLHIFQSGTPSVIANTNVQFEADNNAILSSQNVLTDSEGYAYVTVTSKTAGPVNITARYAGNQQRTTSVTFLQQTGEIAESDLIVDPDNAVADGRDKNVVTAFVKDTSGQPVVGEEVTFETLDGPVLTPVTTTTGDDGKAVAEITSTKAGSFKVTATVNGKSTSKDTTFVADATTARMVLTAVNPLDSHPAGSKANFTASVQDANGNVFKDAEIEVSASGTETTEAEVTSVSGGVANLFVTDTKVGEVSLTVNQKGNSEIRAAETVKFIADVASARVLESDFDTPKANAIANGEDEVIITALVTDQYGNPVDVAATQSAEKAKIVFVMEGNQSPIITQTSSYTYEGNKITQRTRQNNFASFPTYPVVNGVVQDIEKLTINFIPVLISLKTLKDGAQANGLTPNEIEVVVKYGSINSASGVTGAVVDLTADNGAAIDGRVLTEANGTAHAGVRSTNPGISTVTATYVQNGITQQLSVETNFTNAATILENDLVINPNNAVADGADKNIVTAIVTDGNGSPVADEEVSFSVETGPVLTVINGTSDAEGKVVAELTSTVAGSFKVTAVVNGNAVTKNATFVADASTALIELTRTNVQETYVAGTRIGYTAVAKDAHGNTITDAEFNVKAEGGTAASASITATNNGVALLSLYDTRAGETKLTVTLANNAEVAADDTVKYVPDESSAQISNLTVVKDYAFANSSDEDVITFNATDKYQNLLPGVDTSAFTVSVARYGASWVLSQQEDGSFEVKIKGSSVAMHTVVINHDSWSSVQKSVWFKPVVSAEVMVNNASANGLSENVVRTRFYAVARDGSVEGVANARFAFKADNGANLSRTAGYTDSDGYATTTVTNTIPGTTIVKAISDESLYGYTTAEVEVNFEPVVELKDGNVVIDPDNAPADGVSKNVVTATVTNQSGSPVSGAEVSFKVDAGPELLVVKGTTGADGKAVAELTSLEKGVFNVTVKVNDSEVTKPVTFISDAVIKDENMVVDPDGAISNALNRNRVTAIVTDSAGNPLSGETVVFTVEEEPRLYLYPIITTTGDDGKAVAELASGKFGTFNVTATVNGKSTTKPTTFVQWGIGVVEANIIKNNALADEEDTNEIEAKVEDGNFNPVSGAKVTFWVEGNSNARPITFVENEVLTDENGYARTKIKANRPGSYQIVANVYDYSSIGDSAWFTFVTSGLNTDKSALKVTPPIIKANNNESATIELKVRDKFDTSIPGQDVSFVIEYEDGTLPAEGAITLSAVTEGDPVILDESGYYTATLKGATPGRYKITPVVEGDRVGLSEVIELTSTAQILESGLTLELDGSVADGNSRDRINAIVTDFAGKPVAGQQVTFTIADGPVLTPVISLTAEDGKATADITSVKEGVYRVTAEVNGTSASKDVTFVQLKDIAVNGYNFALDADFPKTGFTGAQFTIELTHGNAADYEWTSNASWVSVTDGIVTFSGEGKKELVTINVRAKEGREGEMTYRFELGTWFKNHGLSGMSQETANATCNGDGMKLPSRLELTNVTSGRGERGIIGVFYGEWGSTAAYTSSGFANSDYWTAEYAGVNEGKDYYHYVYMGFGSVSATAAVNSLYAVCVKSL
ncbi:Ig-like domain-containing protein, partial [Enterobacter bugandensis]|nr:Ig-like domain-containing protein [Enterobacter bugandensis]